MLLSNIFNLVYNELLKIFIRKSTWVLYGFLTLIIIAGGFFAYFAGNERTVNYTDEGWQEELQQENAEIGANAEEDIFMLGFNIERMSENDYYLENDLKPVSYGAGQFVADASFMISIVSLLTVIIAGGIVANEFRWGTIKLLLIRPYSRGMILFAKYVGVLSFAVITLLYITLLAWIVGLIFFGFDGFNPQVIILENGSHRYESVILELLTDYGYGLVSLVMMATLAFMISSVFRNSTLAISISIIILLSGSTITLILSRYEWSKYLLFANLNLRQYEEGGRVAIDGMTLPFSITVLAVYYVVFIVLAWWVFGRRDVAGD